MKGVIVLLRSAKCSVALFLTLMSLASCTKMVYVPVESVKTEYKDVIRRDSIHLYDSIYVREKSDTVWIERYKRLYVDRYVRDSVLISDTIRIPYPVETVKVKTEYKTHWYEKALIYLGIGAVLFLLVRFIWERIRNFIQAR